MLKAGLSSSDTATQHALRIHMNVLYRSAEDQFHQRTVSLLPLTPAVQCERGVGGMRGSAGEG